MRFVTMTDPGRLEVAWMWLPFWVAINSQVKAQLDEAVSVFTGREITDDMLDEAHNAVVAALSKEFPLPGLDKFLHGIVHVTP